MTKDQIREINEYRAKEWCAVAQRHNATLLLLIAVGHGEQEGEIHVACPDGLDKDDLATMVENVANGFRAQAAEERQQKSGGN
jgi:hypothetical protein